MNRKFAQIIFLILTFCCIFNIKFVLAAETDVLPSEEEKWDPPSTGPITTWTAPPCGKNQFNAQGFFFYSPAYGLFNSGGDMDPFPDGDQKYQYQEQLVLQYGFTERFDTKLQLLYTENYATVGQASAKDNGISDTYLFLRYAVFEDKGWVPYVTGLFQIKFPTGKYQHFDPNKLGTDNMGANTGGGSYDPGLGLNITKNIKPFKLHGDFVYGIPLERKIDDIKTQYANYLNYDCAIEYFLPKGFNIIVELNGLWQGDKKLNGDKSPGSSERSLILCPGIGWSCDKVRTLLAYQRTLAGINADADDTIVATVTYNF